MAARASTLKDDVTAYTSVPCPPVISLLVLIFSYCSFSTSVTPCSFCWMFGCWIRLSNKNLKPKELPPSCSKRHLGCEPHPLIGHTLIIDHMHTLTMATPSLVVLFLLGFLLNLALIINTLFYHSNNNYNNRVDGICSHCSERTTASVTYQWQFKVLFPSYFYTVALTNHASNSCNWIIPSNLQLSNSNVFLY